MKHFMDYRFITKTAAAARPFDRMLISQAISDKITIVTQDRKFKLYEDLVDVHWND